MKKSIVTVTHLVEIDHEEDLSSAEISYLAFRCITFNRHEGFVRSFGHFKSELIDITSKVSDGDSTKY